MVVSAEIDGEWEGFDPKLFGSKADLDSLDALAVARRVAAFFRIARPSLFSGGRRFSCRVDGINFEWESPPLLDPSQAPELRLVVEY